MRRHRAVVATLVATAALVAACSDDDSDAMPMSPPDMAGDMHHDEPASVVVEGARRVEVVADSFSFDPDEIYAEAGEDLAIALTSEDVLHDFTIDELDAHVAAGATETEVGGVHANEPGSYTYYCSVAGHREAGMEGTLIVR